MEVKSKYESFLVLKRIEIVESCFKKKYGELDELELGVEVKHEFSKLKENVFEVILSTTVSDKNERIYVYVKERAVFNTSQANMDILQKNTIAIMFPYVRSHISIITTQPGMTPIVLPAINIAAMINDQNKE